MIELMILGALISGSKTGYEIKNLLSYTADYFFKVSNGSLYPTLKQFEKKGLIKATEVVENGRCKILYEVTEAGHQTFIDLVNRPLTPPVFKDEMLMRLYFANILPKQVLLNSIDQKLEAVKKLRAELEFIRSNRLEEEMDRNKYLVYQFGSELTDLMDRFYQQLRAELGPERTAMTTDGAKPS